MGAKYTNKTYFEKVLLKYNNKFEYFDDYVNIKHKIKIKCKKHGIFYNTADNHLNGKDGGCKKCQMLKQIERYKKEYLPIFLKMAFDIHGCKYDYSKVDYINNITKVEIVCKEHGSFFQVPSSHLSGRGCSKCGKKTMGGYGMYDLKRAEKFKSIWLNKDCYLYVVKLYNEDEDFIKIGLTNKNNIKSRFNGVCPYKRECIFYIKTNLYNAIQIEQNFHLSNKENKYNCKIKFKGHTECYTKNQIENIKNILLEAQLEIKY